MYSQGNGKKVTNEGEHGEKNRLEEFLVERTYLIGAMEGGSSLRKDRPFALRKRQNRETDGEKEKKQANKNQNDWGKTGGGIDEKRKVREAKTEWGGKPCSNWGEVMGTRSGGAGELGRGTNQQIFKRTSKKDRGQVWASGERKNIKGYRGIKKGPEENKK